MRIAARLLLACRRFLGHTGSLYGPLAANAVGGVGNRLQSLQRDLPAAFFADTVGVVAHPLQRGVDSNQLAAFGCEQLRVDLVLFRVECQIGRASCRERV